jgi:hypothetical protein
LLKKLYLFLNRLKYKVLFSISSFIKTDERQELLNKVDTHLLVWNQKLVDLNSGKSVAIRSLSAEDLALAVDEITQTESKSKQIPHAALYLHNNEFVATEYQLPEIAIQNVTAVLKYQVDDLLPGYPRKLLLAVNHSESMKENIALWLDLQRSEDLFEAFKARNVELTAIIPRIALATLSGNSSVIKQSSRQFKEISNEGILCISLENQNLVQWSSVTQGEMKEDEYFQQWEAALLESETTQSIENSSFFEKTDRTHLDQLKYAFFPDSTRHNLKQRSRLKKGRLAIIAGVIFTLLLAMPFVKNAVRYAKWEKKHLEYKEKTLEVRKMRATVVQFEDNWSLFLDYPKVDVVKIITKLNKIIPKNSWINNFEIEEGVIKIKGHSPSASGILEVISRQAEFEQVAFNQRTQTQKNSESFGIRFRLKNIDMDAYREKYLPNP